MITKKPFPRWYNPSIHCNVNVNDVTGKPDLDIRSSKTIPRGLSVPVGESLPVAIQRIVQALHPEKIILFGSFAYGHPSPDSDVDLLVIMDTDAPPHQRSWAVSRLLLPRFAANHLNTLSEHAVRTRYPGEDPTFQEAEEAIKVAKAVRDFARKILGV